MSGTNNASAQPGLVPGDIVGGKYRIDGVLGSGGMGVVLSATHLELDAPVAIKVVRDDLATNEDIVSRLLFEARAAARMRGTHIVRVLDVARLSSGAPYIVLEQLQGSDLDAVLSERGPLSAADAVSYLLQACEGLAEAHGLGIIHRDLKPENLFLATTPEGVVLKILDFGISKDVGAALQGAHPTLTNAGSAVGSPFYMSPEQMRAAPNLDARADIWSLGAILFELLTGRCPFEAETHALLCAKVMVEEPPSLAGYALAMPELDRIVNRCLQKDPDARYQTVTELADALRAFSAARHRAALKETDTAFLDHVEREPAPPAHAARNPHPKVTQSRAGLALFGACAVLLGAGAGLWHFQSRSEGPMWLSTTRAAAAELPRPAAVRIAAPVTPPADGNVRPTRTANMVMLAAQGPVKPAVLSDHASPAPAHPRVSSVQGSTLPAPVSTQPARPVVITAPAPRVAPASPVPSAGWSAAPRAAAQPTDPENPAQRYGL